MYVLLVHIFVLHVGDQQATVLLVQTTLIVYLVQALVVVLLDFTIILLSFALPAAIHAKRATMDSKLVAHLAIPQKGEALTMGPAFALQVFSMMDRILHVINVTINV